MADSLQIKRANVYEGSRLKNIAFPIGGIGTGLFAISGRGEWVEWQIFNNINKRAVVPGSGLFISILEGGAVRETIPLCRKSENGGGADAGFDNIQFTGEYPAAEWLLTDPKHPVRIRVRGWNPLVPLDARASAMPVAVFDISVTNTGANEMSAAVYGTLLNAIGYDGHSAVDAHSPLFMNNTAETAGIAGSTSLIFRTRAFEKASIGKPMQILAVGHAPRWTDGEAPAGIECDVAASIRNIQLDRYRTIYVNAGADLPMADEWKRAESWVRAGGTFVLSTESGGWIAAAAAGAAPGAVASETITFENFESNNYGKWRTKGNAFGAGPVDGPQNWQNPVSGWTGRGFVDSFQPDDGPHGELESPEFTIERDYIHLKVGGGAFENQTYVELVVGGARAFVALGENSEHLRAVHWDVRAIKGKKAIIRVVDRASGGWGHILLDDIQFSNNSENIKILDAATAQAILTFIGGAPNNAGPASEATRRKVGSGFIYLDGAVRNDEAQWLALLASVAGSEFRSASGMRATDPRFGTLAIGCIGGRVAAIDGAELNHSNIYKQLSDAARYSAAAAARYGAAGNIIKLAPNETKSLTIAVAWNFPNLRVGNKHVGNHYSTRWSDAGAALAEFYEQREMLDSLTKSYGGILYDSTLPWPILDAAGSQSSILRSPTVMWFADGNVAGFEGLGDNEGCCPMNCCHVYNYVQTTAHLFPELERNVRKLDLKHQQDKNGGVHNRISVPIIQTPSGEMPFADGHLGTVLKCYREHLHSPDGAFLQEYWPNIKKALDYAIRELDRDEDGVLEAEQWNTYDQIVTGVNTFVGTLYLAALRAGEEMAKAQGDGASAKVYRKLYESGAARYAEVGWNGEYFEQKGGHEFGAGCLADQLLGEWWARILGLGPLLPREQTRKALESIYKYNFLADFSNFRHQQRVFADGTDRGLLNCTWPRGGRPGTEGYPGRPILYCDEVWTGVEYAVASLMIYEGMVEPAIAIVRAARDRYDGSKRNPWNEIECGDRYARAMSSWSLLIAGQGFTMDGPRGIYRFDPIFEADNHKSLFVGSGGFGTYSQKRAAKSFTIEIACVSGEFNIREIELGSLKNTKIQSAAARLGGAAAEPEIINSETGARLRFAEAMRVVPGKNLVATLE
ncbi:MAG: hypothetical protein HY286_17930 [Planctomycetes bacterium]|nr:hypothetical protein [Planctomycetota bacterium]